MTLAELQAMPIRERYSSEYQSRTGQAIRAILPPTIIQPETKVIAGKKRYRNDAGWWVDRPPPPKRYENPLNRHMDVALTSLACGNNPDQVAWATRFNSESDDLADHCTGFDDLVAWATANGATFA